MVGIIVVAVIGHILHLPAIILFASLGLCTYLPTNPILTGTTPVHKVSSHYYPSATSFSRCSWIYLTAVEGGTCLSAV